MKKSEKRWQLRVRRAGCMLALVVIAILPLDTILSGASSSGGEQPDWAAPSAMAVRRVSGIDTHG